MGKPRKVEITKGVLKGKKGKIVTTDDTKYGTSHMIQTDDGELIRPVYPDEMRDV